MARRRKRKRRDRRQILFWILSLIVVLSMVFGFLMIAIPPGR
ncbi:MAG: hypothetical protein ACE5NP_04980 [Anaerolineae bacterium]